MKLPAEHLAEILIADPEIFRHSSAAVIGDPAASEQLSGLVQKRAGRRNNSLLSVHVVDREDETLGFQKQLRQLSGGSPRKLFIKQETFVQKSVCETGIKDRTLRQKPHVQQGTVGLVPKTDKKLQPFPILFCDGGMTDIGNALNEASGIDPGAFSVLVDVDPLAAQEEESSVVFKDKVFILGKVACVMDKAAAQYGVVGIHTDVFMYGPGDKKLFRNLVHRSSSFYQI